jgi:hypothetical protein
MSSPSVDFLEIRFDGFNDSVDLFFLVTRYVLSLSSATISALMA